MHGYALRRLNPFRGMLQVVEQGMARALSEDARLWRIQVLAEHPDHDWRSSATRHHRRYFNWGLWSRERGLHRVNANPLLDIGTMQRQADALLTALVEVEPLLPFAPGDHFEYWACDYKGLPVALMGSALQRETARGSSDTVWRATAMGDHEFVSKTLAAVGIAAHDGFSPRVHAERLESAVRHRAQSRHWFERLPDGSGRRLDNDQLIDATAFPPLGLATDWDDPLIAGLVADYLEWLAPVLLTLPDLGDSERAGLEQAAMGRALRVADLYRLYPRIIQPELIERARVEARLREAHRD